MQDAVWLTVTDINEYMHNIDQAIEYNNSRISNQDDVAADLPPIDGVCNGHLIDK